jgi:tRNA G10  N-methylase Trm11
LAKPGEDKVADLFCGAGGSTLAAVALGLDCYAVDFDKAMVFNICTSLIVTVDAYILRNL